MSAWLGAHNPLWLIWEGFWFAIGFIAVQEIWDRWKGDED